MRVVPTSSSLPARIETEGLFEFSIEIVSEFGDLGPLRVSITSGSPEIKIESGTVAFESFVHEDVAFAVNRRKPASSGRSTGADRVGCPPTEGFEG